MSQHPESAPKRKRRWWLRILLAALVLLLLIGLLGPVLAAPALRSMVVERMNSELDATASLERLSFNLGGALHAGGFELATTDGAPLASMERLDAHVSVLALARGRLALDLSLVGFEVDVRQAPDGSWNFGRVMKESAPAKPTPSEPTGKAGSLPQVRAKVLVRDGRVRVHTDEGITALEDIHFELALEELDQPAPFSLGARVVGPGGPAGVIDVHGELTLARDGRIGADTIEALVEASLESLILAELSPLAALSPAATGTAVEQPAPVRITGGSLDVTSTLRVARGPSIEAEFALAMDGLAFEGPAGASRLEGLRVEASASADPQGSGRHQLMLELPGSSSLRVTGESRGLFEGDGRVLGELVADGDLSALMELARGIAPLVPGRELAGSLSAKASWDLPVSAGAGAGSFVMDAGLEGLSLRDESGRELELGGLRDARFQLSATLDGEEGKLDLGRFELEAGPLRATARAGIAGLALDGVQREIELTDSSFDLEADLDALNGIVREFVELGEGGFGGAVSIQANARDVEGLIASTASLRVTGLRVDTGTPFGPLDLSFDFKAALDPSEGGRSTIERVSLESEFLVVEGGGELIDIARPELAQGRLELRSRFDPVAANRVLAPWLEGHVLGGEALVQRQTIEFEAGELVIDSALEAPRLAVSGPAFGPEGLELRALVLSLAASTSGSDTSTSWKLEPTTLGWDAVSGALAAEGEAAPASFTLGALEVGLSGSGDEEGAAMAVGATLASVTLEAPGEPAVRMGAMSLNAPAITYDAGAGEARVERFELESELMGGRGEFVLAGLSEVDARPRFTGGLALEGEFAPLTALVRAVAGDEAAPQLSGAWSLGVELEAGEERAELTSLALAVPGLDLSARGFLTGFEGDAPDPVGDFVIEPSLKPDAFGAWAAPLLAGATMSGAPFEGRVDVGLTAGVVKAGGELSGARLELTLPAEEAEGLPPTAARTLVQRDVKLTFELMHDPALDGGRLDLSKVHAESGTGRFDASGAITGTAEPDNAQAELELSMSGALARVLEDFAAFMPVPGIAGSGALELDARVVGGAQTAVLTGSAKAKELALVVPIDDKPEPVRMNEPLFSSEFGLQLSQGGEAVAIERMTLDSETLRGTLSGRWFGVPADQPQARARFEAMKGDYTYVPDRLGPWLAPWLPGELRGAERLPLRFVLNGEVDELDTLAMLRLMKGDANLELAEIALPGFTVSGGSLALVAGGDELVMSGSLAANGGQVEFGGRLDLREQVAAGAAPLSSTLSAKVAGVSARPELAPLLAYVHPMFGALDAAGAGSLAGSISSQFFLKYEAPLTTDALTAGFAALTKRAIAGGGNLELKQVSLSGSPLLSSMVTLLDPKGGGAVTIDPVNFGIQEGRLGYDKPWQWTIAGSPTQFGGTLGLDGSLAMSWQVPVTQSLVQRHGFLRYFEGETIEVPLQGTVSKPSLSLQATLDGLAKTTLERELKEQAGKVLPDLGDILGGGGGSSGPDQLLKRADELYSKGDKAGAAKLYSEIKRKHSLTLTYIVNKSRIDSRRNEN